jgi:hypothetical protein
VALGTARASLHILGTLLNFDAGPKPELVVTDTGFVLQHGLRLFRMLDYRFSPRNPDPRRIL